MAKNPVLPVYYNDLLGSTQDWTDEELGAYMRLLIYQWDKGSIPKEPARRVRIADSADRHWALLSAKFPAGENGILQNLRLEEIREERRIHSEKQKENIRKRYQNATKPPTKPITKNLPLEEEDENEEEVSGNIGGVGEKGDTAPATDPGAFLVPRMFTAWKQAFPKYPLMQETDFPALHDLAHCLADQLAKPKDFGDKAICNAILELWYSLVEHVKGHSHFSTYNLHQVGKYIQSILQSYHKPKAPDKSGIQYLYERFLEGEKVARLITDEHYQQLNAVGLVAVDAALLKQTQATRLKALDSPQNANERELHTLYKAGKLDDPLVVTDRAGVELKAKRTAIHNFFRRQKEAKATDVLTVKK